MSKILIYTYITVSGLHSAVLNKNIKIITGKNCVYVYNTLSNDFASSFSIKKRAFPDEIAHSQEEKEEEGTSYAFERAFSKNHVVLFLFWLRARLIK